MVRRLVKSQRVFDVRCRGQRSVHPRSGRPRYAGLGFDLGEKLVEDLEVVTAEAVTHSCLGCEHARRDLGRVESTVDENVDAGQQDVGAVFLFDERPEFLGDRPDHPSWWVCSVDGA